jgi:hypothetical protein
MAASCGSKTPSQETPADEGLDVSLLPCRVCWQPRLSEATEAADSADRRGPESDIEDFRNILSTNPCTAPQVLLTLPGTPGKPIAFGSRKRGTTTSKRLQIANLSDYPLSITTLVASTDYGITNDQCTGQTLSPGQTCSIIATLLLLSRLQ